MKAIRLIKPFFAEKRVVILVGLLSLIVVDFLQLIIPRIIKKAVDDLTSFHIEANGLYLYALWIVGLGLIIGVFRYIWRRCLLGTSRRVEEGLRNQLFGHLQMLSAAYFDGAKTGDLMAHATNDIMQVRMATGMGLVALNDAIVLGSAAIAFMAYINLRLTLLVLIPMPLIIWGTRTLSRKMHRRYRRVQGAFADLTESVRERFAGVRIIKAYNREKEQTEKMGAISKDYIRENLMLVRITGAFFPMMLLLSNLSLAIVLFVGGRQAIKGIISPGDFVAFMSYLALLTWPMMAMGWVTNLIQRGAASLERIDGILKTRPAIQDHPTARPLSKARGALAFENVHFGYPSSKASMVLANINFQLEPGQVLGVVGPQGSGKTTLLNLIPRLYDVSEGRIRLDGIDIRDLRVADLRAQIAFMSQEPFMFAGTVGENVALGAVEYDTPALWQVAREARIAGTIENFRRGFETVVGEKGVILSGGQKQRIALARALLQEAPVLILDDPISQVDTEVGAAIIQTIRARAGEQTIIVASHRLSAVQFADRIIVLEQGRITGAGRHAELMTSNPYYAKTFRLQALEEEAHAI